MKVALPSVVKTLTNINLSISASCFPDRLKAAQVTPLFMKNDPMTKSNYRPDRILPTASKLFEKVFSNQLYDYFEKNQ